MLIKGTVLMFVVGEVVFNLTYPLLGMLLVPSLGLTGAVAAYGVNYIFYLAYVLLMVCVINGKTWSSNG